ncbi:hypothetical protein ACIQK6_13720 [Streptomyces sp. NPDC091682]|uniref:hypothetical protein n=1 Tax=Streptomyces sp. NPDC091682 TaxID=3366005 RepID=UPI003822F0A0
MIRIITASTHAALISDRDELGRTRAALDTARRATDEAEAFVEDHRRTNLFLAQELRDPQRDTAGQLLDVEKVVRQLTDDRDTACEEAGALDEVRQDVIRLRDHAADPANGNAVRGAIAYGVLRDLITRARQERAAAGETGGLPRPFDVVALVLGLDVDQDDADASAPVREDTAADCMGGTCSCADRSDEEAAAPAGTRECAACGARRPAQDFNHGAICRNCPAMTASH